MATSPRRRWLRPPQLRTLDADQDERHATWLELFFDLVFVISIAEVVHTLEDYRTPADFAGTAGLFGAVWWAWVGGSGRSFLPVSSYSCSGSLDWRSTQASTSERR